MYAVTHNGAFHSDDVFAAAVLRLAHPGIEIFRTRDQATIDNADIVFDVGGEYAAALRRYDHHQRGGAGERPNGIPYAAFGLVWLDYGPEVCGSVAVAEEVDRLLVQAIDAGDNGVDLATPLRDDARVVTVAHTISWMNPSWDEEDLKQGSAFEQAVALATTVLQRCIVRARGTLAAADIVASAIADAADPRLIVLPRFCPWQEHLVPATNEALFVVYESFGTYRVQAVPQALGSFTSRQLLPEAWGGLDGEELAEVTGVADATFCHKGRFIAGAQTLDGALALAALALLRSQHDAA